MVISKKGVDHPGSSEARKRRGGAIVGGYPGCSLIVIMRWASQRIADEFAGQECYRCAKREWMQEETPLAWRAVALRWEASVNLDPSCQRGKLTVAKKICAWTRTIQFLSELKSEESQTQSSVAETVSTVKKRQEGREDVLRMA